MERRSGIQFGVLAGHCHRPVSAVTPGVGVSEPPLVAQANCSAAKINTKLINRKRVANIYAAFSPNTPRNSTPAKAPAAAKANGRTIIGTKLVWYGG